LKKKLNKALKIFGSRKYFENFPKQFASDPCKKRNKIILDMTLREIFEKKELYVKENKKGWANYWHNLKVVQSDEIKGNREFQKILNKTFRQLYEEYINSDVFKIKKARIQGRGFTSINPKYIDKAARIVQAWWRERKERYIYNWK